MEQKPAEKKVVCLLFRDRNPAINELAEACFRFTPKIALRGNEAIFLDIGASLTLFHEKTILVRLSALAQRFGYFPQIGVAEDAPTALAMAHHGCSHKSKLPIEALLEFSSPFYFNDILNRKVHQMITNLKMLGIRTLQDFIQIPAYTLASRFGSEGTELSSRVLKSIVENDLFVVWPHFQMAESIFEIADLENDSNYFGPCSEIEPLLFVLKNLADRAMARLHGRSLRASAIEIEFRLEKSSTLKETHRKWLIRLPIPQGSVPALLPIIRERLMGDLMRKPLPAVVAGIAFKIIETAPGHRTQRSFFDQTEEQAETWEALVGRLCHKLGDHRAFIAQPIDRHLPEHAWKPTLEDAPPNLSTDSSTISQICGQRPARLLKRPTALRQQGEFLFKDSRRWQVAEWHGPERISAEWWRDPEFQGFNRDYYRVITDNGEQLWVFAIPGRIGLYLHGYFD